MKKKRRSIKEQNTICDYPILDQYKYLGMTITNSISVKQYMKDINKKCEFIRYSTYNLRRNADPRLLINLFKILIIPIFRLITGIISFIA